MPTTCEMVSLPLVAKDGIMMAAFYTADRSKVCEIIPDKHFIPAVLPNNQTAVAFFAIEYPTVRVNDPETDIGVDPYNEILVAVPAVLGDSETTPPTLEQILNGEVQDVVYYIHHIAVTTRMAQLLGNEFLGYNKFICDIKFEDTADARTCVVSNDNKALFSLKVSPKPSSFELHREKPTVASYDCLYGRETAFKLTYENQSKIAITMDPIAELQLGDHPLAEIISGLNLSEKPFQVRYAPVFQLVSDDKNLEIVELKK